ncbi:radical SAM family heme chaperone HemW [Octadecabacter sp. 1_MG-2023]|uniref:radical SAM family heme chaperone HemW n=1 Tax=unclassified Octadecabacter TaxID=196158 RepID=UPI001C08377F|nr:MULTISPECIES: radical SAM family heme chaperone HemW [unclassified Octadecabacter]MBU2992307.1 radical SAM family heme chaperone HemW [Octadecabacter sp. B2R22]MDO6734936.1 radical SAM family heme chaperone HemW [Octadecabacter sp. 1_MG-2023]
MPEGGFGLYIHWPFCQAKCPYCDFNSHVVASIDQSRWAAAFESEIDRIAALTSDRVLNSIFFGGGTPSLMDVSTVERILNRVRKHWRLANDLEVTLEANPTSIEAERFSGYHAAGVNRVSIGVQALNDLDLKALGRLHSADEALIAIDLARNVFDRVSFDLIYARQGQSVSQWEDELSRALRLDPDHLSLYQLTIEDGTAFGDRFKRGLLRNLPDEDLSADLWDTTQEICDAAGLPAYEVSNHAKEGQESRHNLIYWNSGDWAGIGPGAHGRLTVSGKRFETVSAKMPGDWIGRVETGSGGDLINSPLSSEAITEERVLMGLRMSQGIVLPEPWIKEKMILINNLQETGHLDCRSNRLTVTKQGRPVLNAIIAKLLSD